MLHIIANPHSGSGRLAAAKFCRLLKRSSVPCSLHVTDSETEARQLLSASSLTGKDILLLIGGDGSLSGAVNSLPEGPDPAPSLMLLPTGSGNDFARGLGMDKSPEAALSLLRQEDLAPCSLDCGEAMILSAAPRSGEIADNTEGNASSGIRPPRRFVVSCGIGYDAGVCDAINHSRLKTVCNRLHLGKIAYLILGIRQIFLYKKASLRLTPDDGSDIVCKNTAFVSVHNLPYEGGGFPFAPAAGARDGMLNLCVVTAPNRFIFTLTLLMSLLGGKHILLPNVRQISCRSLRVTSDTPLPFHTDGEVTRDVTAFSVRVLPEAIRLYYAVK